MYLGIDLGTTNTVVSRSFVDSDGKLVSEVVSIGQMSNDNWEKFDTLPSMVYFDTEGFIGDTKGGIIVGREAKRQRNQDKAHVVMNAKRFMGTTHKWEIEKNSYEAKDIASMVLQHCKKTIDREGNMNSDTVVITVPASFNPEQISDTLIAAKQAGFNDDQVIIKHEPTAALLSFIDSASRRKSDDINVDFSTPKRVLVFDLGGGTCDTSVIDVQVGAKDRELRFTEVGIGRYQELGGIDFDSSLARGLLQTFFEKNDIMEGDIAPSEQAGLYDKLVLAAETLKEKLSAAIYSKLAMSDGDVDVDNIQVKLNIPNFYGGKPYRIVITKAEYDRYTQNLYIDNDVHYKKFEDMDKNKNIIGVIRKTLEDYDIKKSSIDYVFMTGGMSQFITVREKVSEYIGKDKVMITPENPMEAVAIGASIYQYYKVREEKQSKGDALADEGEDQYGIVDSMMLAEAVLLDMNEGLPKVIIPKKTLVPDEGELVGAFRTSSPSGVRLDIYAAENEYDSSMRIQKSIEKHFIHPVESGTPFDIRYKINENKAIEMQIIIGDSHHQELDISIRSDLKITEKNYNLVMEE